MQALNRAIEDASDFTEMMRKLRHGAIAERAAVERVAAKQSGTVPPKRPGENREQYRARINAKA